MVKTYSQDDIARHQSMLVNRVKKILKHIKPKFERQNTGAFRLYDWDIPEIRAVVDWYEGSIVLGEYVREQTEDGVWVEAMADALADGLGLAREDIHIRRRTTRPKDGDRYQRLERSNQRITVRENGLKFLVNLQDYLDVGLFLDHRNTRSLVRDLAKGKSFLNLFAYTGSFTVYAAAGEASSTTTVDLSGRYLDWARDNLKANDLADSGKHEFVPAETREFLVKARHQKQTWDLIMLDPPSFSTREGMSPFDVQLDHRELVEDCLHVLAPGGVLFFSTNHQRFEPDLDGLPVKSCTEISAKVLPLDFKERTPHRLFRIEGNG